MYRVVIFKDTDEQGFLHNDLVEKRSTAIAMLIWGLQHGFITWACEVK